MFRFPMGTYFACLIADLSLILLCKKFHGLMKEIIQELNSTSRYLDDLLYIDNLDFEGWWVELLNLIQ